MRLKEIQVLYKYDDDDSPLYYDDDEDEDPNPKVLKVASSALLTHVLGISIDKQTSQHGTRLATVMKKLGWKRTKGRKEYIDSVSVSGFHISERELKRRIEKDQDDTY